MERDTILITDDAQLNRELIKFIFEEQFNILEAENGEQAIELIQENSVFFRIAVRNISPDPISIKFIIDGFRILLHHADRSRRTVACAVTAADLIRVHDTIVKAYYCMSDLDR